MTSFATNDRDYLEIILVVKCPTCFCWVKLNPEIEAFIQIECTNNFMYLGDPNNLIIRITDV